MSDYAPRAPLASSEREPAPNTAASWVEAAEQLRALRERQRQAWGDVDSSTLGRYLANEVDAGERERVEAEMASHPELARLTELVRDVLADFEPEEVPAPVVPAPLLAPAAQPAPAAEPITPPTVEAEEPAVLAFVPRPRSFFGRYKHELALAAAACVLVAVGWGVLQYASPPEASRSLLDQASQKLSDPTLRDNEVGPFVDAALAQANRDRHVVNQPRFAETLEQYGDWKVEKGQYDGAEQQYRQAHQIRKELAGPDAPETVRTSGKLANLYQLGLNTANDAPPAGGQMRLLAQPAPGTFAEAAFAKAGGPVVAEERRLRNLQEFGTRLAERAPEVYPFLVQDLRQSDSKADKLEDRLACLQALARVGPAARDAAPLVLDRFHKANNPAEKRVALVTLGRIAGGTPEVIQVLTTVIEQDARLAPDAGRALLELGPAGKQALERICANLATKAVAESNPAQTATLKHLQRILATQR